MNCPNCEDSRVQVLSTRRMHDKAYDIPRPVREDMGTQDIWRRRRCTQCKHTWDTIETIHTPEDLT